jgi:hypothetical protein
MAIVAASERSKTKGWSYIGSIEDWRAGVSRGFDGIDSATRDGWLAKFS